MTFVSNVNVMELEGAGAKSVTVNVATRYIKLEGAGRVFDICCVVRPLY